MNIRHYLLAAAAADVLAVSVSGVATAKRSGDDGASATASQEDNSSGRSTVRTSHETETADNATTHDAGDDKSVDVAPPVPPQPVTPTVPVVDDKGTDHGTVDDTGDDKGVDTTVETETEHPAAHEDEAQDDGADDRHHHGRK